MGTLTYDGALRVDFEDRLLLHLQLVVSAKLRRGESFIFTWTKSVDDGGGRTSVWVDRTIPIMFEYRSNEMPDVSRSWIDELTRSAQRLTGLQITPDPGATSDQPRSLAE